MVCAYLLEYLPQALMQLQEGKGYQIISHIQCKFSHCSIYVRWILGHEGIQSNEVVDDTAKNAITEGSSHNIVLPALLHKIKTFFLLSPPIVLLCIRLKNQPL